MNHYIPRFIVQNFTAGVRQGELEAYSLFLDISGFTAMTETLMTRGKGGAEVLSQIINELFEDLIRRVYASGGFISTFAGDAFTVLFPRSAMESRQLRDCVLGLAEVFYSKPIRQTKLGDFHLKVKIGVGQGLVQWSIAQEGDNLAYFFQGSAIDGAAQAEQLLQGGQIAIPSSLWNHDWDEVSASTEAQGSLVVATPRFTEELMRELKKKWVLDPSLEGPAPQQFIERFVPASSFPPGTGGEFRDISSVFISYDDKAISPQSFFGPLSRLTSKYGAYLNLFDFGDKAGVVLVLFGAPVSTGDNLRNALDYCLELRTMVPELSMGVASGSAFTGYVGSSIRRSYTALGRVINLSARLAMVAKPGEILGIKAQWANRFSDYHSEERPARKFKGFDQELSVLALQGKATHSSFVDGPFVGRTQETSLVSASFQQLTQGSYQGALSIEGEVGSGKTALLERVIQAFEGQDQAPQILRLEYQSLVKGYLEPLISHMGSRFGAFLQEEQTAGSFTEVLFRDFSPDLPDYLRNELLRGEPALLRLMGVKRETDGFEGLDPRAIHDRSIEALLAYFSAMVHSQKLLIVVDGAEKMDEASVELFDRLLSRETQLPLAVIFLSRSRDFLRRFTIPMGQSLVLEPLGTNEIGELTQALLGSRANDRLVKVIQERSNGNPLYVKEIVLYLKERGLVRSGVQGLELIADESEVLPPSLETLVIASVDKLGPTLKELSSLAAVLGQRFESKVLESMVESGAMELKLDASLDQALGQLTREGIISPVDGSAYHFNTSSIRDSLYNLQFNQQLEKLHRMAAEALEQLYSSDMDRAAEKAYHYDRSSQPKKAVEMYQAAASLGAERYQNQLALGYYQRLLELSTDDELKAAVHLARAQIFDVIGDFDGSRDALERGVGLATVAGRADLYQEFFSKLGTIAYRRGDNPLAKGYYAKALEAANYREVTTAAAQVRIELAKAHMRDAEFGEAFSRLFEARDIARSKGFELEEGRVLYNLGSLYQQKGELEQAREYLEASYGLFKRLGELRLTADPQYNLSLMYLGQGKLDKALSGFEDVVKTYAQVGYKSGLAAALSNIGSIMDQRGDFDQALDYFTRSRNIAQEIEETPAIGYALYNLGASAFKKQEYPQALTYLNQSFSVFQTIELKTYYGYPLSYLVSTHGRMGNQKEALQLAADNLRLIQDLGQDPERGRVYLALAEILERYPHSLDHYGEQWQPVLQLVSSETGSPAAMYTKAIVTSREPMYYSTHIPALYRYGKYMITRGGANQMKGEKLIKAAHGHCKKAGWEHFVQLLEQEFGSLLTTREPS